MQLLAVSFCNKQSYHIGFVPLFQAHFAVSIMSVGVCDPVKLSCRSSVGLSTSCTSTNEYVVSRVKGREREREEINVHDTLKPTDKDIQERNGYTFKERKLKMTELLSIPYGVYSRG